MCVLHKTNHHPELPNPLTQRVDVLINMTVLTVICQVSPSLYTLNKHDVLQYCKVKQYIDFLKYNKLETYVDCHEHTAIHMINSRKFATFYQNSGSRICLLLLSL